MSKPDYILDLSGMARAGEGDPLPSGSSHEEGGPTSGLRRRPWLAIHWRCCSVYSRIYRQPEAPMYEGRCPRCARPLRIAVGEGGTDTRFFEAR